MGVRGGEGAELTRLATVPDMEAIMAMLPPLPQRIISLATACAVMKTPVMLTWSSVSIYSSSTRHSNELNSPRTSCWRPWPCTPELSSPAECRPLRSDHPISPARR